MNLRCLYFSGGEGGSAHIDQNLKYVLIFKELPVQFQDKKALQKDKRIKNTLTFFKVYVFDVGFSFY